MWLFDSLILEEEKTSSSSTNLGGSFSSQQTQSSWQAKQDDGSFLIINDDNVTIPEISLDITSDDIPDTAISFATQNQDLQIPEISEESITFNDDPLVSFIENDDISTGEDENILPIANWWGVDFFSESVLTEESIVANNDSILTQEIIEDKISFNDGNDEQVIDDSFLETHNNTVVEAIEVQDDNINIGTNLDSSNTNNFEIKQESVELAELNLTQIIAKSIEDSEKFLDWQNKIKENLLKQIEDINKQIADLKTKAKTLTEETKVVNLEEEKAKKLIETFKNYK